MNLLEVKNICKTYGNGETAVKALKDVSFSVPKGEYVAIVGESGSGKSTLLNMIGALDTPTSGKVLIDGKDIFSMNDKKLTVFRRRNIGFVFQAYHMLPELNICENVMLPSMLDGMSKKEAREKALVLLDRVGLAHRVRHRANELSGGEQQRAAIARSLMNSPELLLADEPTGNLDSVTGQGILDIFHELRSEGGMTIVMVTHDKYVAGLAGRTVELKDGMLI